MTATYIPSAAPRGGRREKNQMLFVSDAAEQLNIQALRAKNDEALLEELIRRNRRFILTCAYKATHRFVSESDDEWSIALIAFHEAVQTYDAEKGSFKSFAALVIRRRLLDELDRAARRKNEIAADLTGAETSSEEEPTAAELEVRRAVAAQSMERDGAQEAMRDEIAAAQQLLRGYGFSFFDLADCSPKAKKTKAGCAVVIRALIADDALMDGMRASGTLPIKELCLRTGVPRKLVENHRRYIIAAAELLRGDFPQLAEYLRFVRKGAEDE